jgi:hypothetical protein
VKLSDDVIEEAFTSSATVVQRYLTRSAVLWAFRRIESQIQVPEKQSTFHPHALRSVFHRKTHQFVPSSLIETNVCLHERTQRTCSKHTKRRKADMKNNKWFKLIGAAVLGLMILGFAVPSGQTAPTVTLTALV